MLWQIGSVSFEVWPFNLTEHERTAGADYVSKDVVGAPKPREFVGEGDDKRSFTAVLYPFHFGGLPNLDVLDAMRLSGQPQPLLRGDGTFLNWWTIDLVGESSTNLSKYGVGKKIVVKIDLTKAAQPSQQDMLTTLLSLF